MMRPTIPIVIPILLTACLCRSALPEDNAAEIQQRLKYWERYHPEYTLPPNTPTTDPHSVTEANGWDRTGSEEDPLAAAFIRRGYFLLRALRTKREMAPLSAGEIETFWRALHTTRVEFVDSEQFDNAGKQVVSIVIPNPAAPSDKLIRVYRKDWLTSQRLGVDLVRLVFHEYLRVIGKYDDNYVTSIQLLVTERDFAKRTVKNADCLSEEKQPASISLNIAAQYPYAHSPSYVNGSPFDGAPPTTFRVYRSVPVCTANAYTFALSVGTFRKTVYLYGSDDIIVMVPSGKEYYRP